MKTYKTEVPRITLAMLVGACREQRAAFRKEWPEGAEVTLENVRRAQELSLSLVWGERWFTPLAQEAYDEATAPALKVYDEARAQALKAYLGAIAPAWKAYKETTAPAWKAYNEATAQAWKAYKETTAPAWVEAYLQSVEEREAQPSKAS